MGTPGAMWPGRAPGLWASVSQMGVHLGARTLRPGRPLSERLTACPGGRLPRPPQAVPGLQQRKAARSYKAIAPSPETAAGCVWWQDGLCLMLVTAATVLF